MTKKILVALILLSSLTLSAQTTKEPNCKKLIAKGYTQTFCDYDKKYAFKTIPLESNFEFVSKKCDLKKDISNPYHFETTDDKLKFWGGVSFDKCMFDFSANDKLDGVQLLLTVQTIGPGGPTDIKVNIEKMEKIKSYLITMFGQPFDNTVGKNLVWYGENITVYLTSNFSDGLGSVAIYRTNMKMTDDL
ncbi:MAG: hypothetical protein KF825_06740 [Ferruginibacter sp.]|nr:hypothetical protein [Ferruginibacter sp.]